MSGDVIHKNDRGLKTLCIRMRFFNEAQYVESYASSILQHGQDSFFFK